MFQFMLKSFLFELRCSIQVKSQVFFHVWTFILCREFSDEDIFFFISSRGFCSLRGLSSGHFSI